MGGKYTVTENNESLRETCGSIFMMLLILFIVGGSIYFHGHSMQTEEFRADVTVISAFYTPSDGYCTVVEYDNKDYLLHGKETYLSCAGLILEKIPATVEKHKSKDGTIWIKVRIK